MTLFYIIFLSVKKRDSPILELKFSVTDTYEEPVQIETGYK